MTATATVTTATSTAAEHVLTDDMLARFDERAPMYDRENRFFHDDFEELRESGYLKVAVPTELGGLGLGIDEVVKLQRRLAYVAPATAVAVNMHIYWTAPGSSSSSAIAGSAVSTRPTSSSPTR